MSKFFIDRPVFAWVIAIVIMLGGLFSIHMLPVEQYPRIAPPSVIINAQYPGASAQTLENSVTQVIEQKLTGIDYLRYFSSASDSMGNVAITLTFEPEADPDIAQVQVQNKLQAAMPILPEEVKQQGILITKGMSGFLMVAAFYSKDESVQQLAIGDYINSKIADPISRIPGVGSLTIFGQPYAMRIWLDPNKMNNFHLATSDIEAAIRAQNADVSLGQLSGNPAIQGQQLNATISAQSRLSSIEEFKNILLRVNSDGSQVRLHDVARVELGIQNYDMIARYNGYPAAGFAISLAAGANALDTAQLVKEKIKELSPFMPRGFEVGYPYDTTPFVKISIYEVVKTLIESIILVFVVMYLFLQNFRATLIPTIAIPVVLLGTFAVLALCGYSINTLTMFAMVLAIGLLVDDAIVVVENVERVMKEEGLSAKEATQKSMKQITGALVGIALVLSAVFVPMAFFSGSTGAIYRQFSLTIVSAMTLSVVVALVLTPALCATLLKADHREKTSGFFGLFNKLFDKSKKSYATKASFVAAKTKRFMVIYAVLLIGLVFLFQRLTTAFLPNEDQGILFVQVAAPPGCTTERTLESIKKVERYFLTQEKKLTESIFSVVGFSFAGRGQNSAIAFVRLKHWDERIGNDATVFAVANRAMSALSTIKDALVFAFYPPPMIELGHASGFDLELLDRAGLGHDALVGARNQFLGMAAQNPKLMAVRPNGLSDVAEYKLDIDHEKACALGLSIHDINSTLQTAWGSTYISDFMHEGRIKKVFMQADAPFRMAPDDMHYWYVRNDADNMVPISTITTSRWMFGSPKLERYNGFSSQQILGAPAPGISSGDAMASIQSMAKQLPPGIDLEWSGLSYEERTAGSQRTLLYSLSILFVFLCLAALYESWSIPFAVMLVIPLGLVGAVVATWTMGLYNDVYFQVGLLTTIGLAAKNTILIVEFAKALHDKGTPVQEAALIAAEQRLRPILMTSLAFIFGVTPLAIATGAGSASQNAIGVGVIGGMISATFIAIFFVPMFYIFIQKRFGAKKDAPSDARHSLQPLVAIAFTALFATGCTMAPKYNQPAMPVDATWPQGPSYQQIDEKPAAVMPWREFFLSPHLQTIIQTALDNNRDLRIAALNIEVACATYRAERADLFPHVNIGGAYSRSHAPKSEPQEVPEGFIAPPVPPSTVTEYSANIASTSYELDLFGKIRSLTERDLELYFATSEAKSSVQIALIAEVANAYLTYLADKKLLNLTEETLTAQLASFDVISQSFEMGNATQLDVSQAATSVENARANLYLYTRRVAQDKNALILLMGSSIDEAMLEGTSLDDVRILQDLPVGLSSQILLNRPDIKKAEHELKAANANIGAARAAFFPTIALTGSYGSTSESLHKLLRFNSGATWNFVTNITQPIFAGGQNIANLDNAKAREKIAVARYEKAIQMAFREVADELAARGTYTQQLQAQRSLVSANQKSYDLAMQRYKHGVSTYLNVLDSQQGLYSAEQGAIIVQQRTISNMITLYKVLGGGEQ
jgi:HAE1 family hydrophobic/amphiphilic exporter-1/multidrug efflux pump